LATEVSNVHKGENRKASLAKGEAPRAVVSTVPPLSPLATRYWEDPFSWMSEFDRYFDNLRRNMDTMLLPSASTWFPASTTARAALDTAPARYDLADEGKEFVLTADVPGFDRNEVNVEVTPTSIEIHAEKSQESSQGDEKKGYITKERAYRSLHRVLTFPEEVVPDNVQAELKNGVLSVRIPKANPSEEKKIKVPIK